MRFDGVVSYGDDPWASDVWHVLLQGRIYKVAWAPGSRVGAFWGRLSIHLAERYEISLRG